MPFAAGVIAQIAATLLPAVAMASDAMPGTLTADDRAPCSTSPTTQAIRSRREAFNTSIANKDVDGIAAVLSEDALLVTGTDSDRFTGRVEQLELWAEDFARPDRLVYVRTSECIEPSARFPIALERGRWRGEAEGGAGLSFAAGRYSAKWRYDGSAWQVEAELYMTEDCGGAMCPGND